MFKKERIPIKVLDQLTTYMVVATVIGARLGHCLFYEPAYYLSHPLDILKVWEGGLASHGAAIGIIIALLIFSKRNNLSFLWVIDRIAVVTALAGFFIRMGNLMNSEIFGIPTDVSWSFIFVRAYDPLMAIDPRHPTQIYEALAYLTTFGYLISYYYRKNGKPSEGFLIGMFMILIFTARFFIEFIKEPQVGFEQSLMLNMGQILSIPFVLIGIGLVIYSKRKQPAETTG
jgi:prolipoprotein diacylglyceryl transferase